MMDPRKLFHDNRLLDVCVYCGQKSSTRDHVPSRVLLDEPFPNNLPVVAACERCNLSFSLDEQYLACIVECAVTGTTRAEDIRREKVRRILAERPAIAARIVAARVANDDGALAWQVETTRVRDIVLKLARGHVAYQFAEATLADPVHVAILPFPLMSPAERIDFEHPPSSTSWPEVGSRAFVQAVTRPTLDSIWTVVQPDRYRYALTQRQNISVRIVLSEYLGCEVIWN